MVIVAGLPWNPLGKTVSWSPGPPEPTFHTLPLPLYPQRVITEHSLESTDVLKLSNQGCLQQGQLTVEDSFSSPCFPEPWVLPSLHVDLNLENTLTV